MPPRSQTRSFAQPGAAALAGVALLAAAPSAAAEVSYQQGQGLQVRSADGLEAIGLSARIALRHTADFAGAQPFDLDHWRSETQVRTARLWLTGRQGGSAAAPRSTWGMQLGLGGRDVETDAPTPLLDAFVRVQLLRDVSLQLGQWLVPFDRARTVRESALQLVDRAVAVRELTLDRDAGAALSSDDALGLGGRLLLHLGVFGGEGRNRFAAQGFPKGPLVLARVEARPLGGFDAEIEGDLARRDAPKLAIGLAGAYAWSATRSRGTSGAAFAGAATADYRWWAADLVVKWRGASLLAELVERQQHGASSAVGRASGRGAEVQAGYMLGPEVELACRWSRLWPLSAEDQPAAASPLQAMAGHELGAGVNWYLAGHRHKLQLDAQHSWNVGTGSGLGGARGAQLVRLALDVTF